MAHEKPREFPTNPIEILRINDAHRHPDVTDDLWTADELAALPPQPYRYQVLTYTPAVWPAPRRVTQKAYTADFARRHPIAQAVLEAIVDAPPGADAEVPRATIVVAGGAAASPYYERDAKAGDVDFFITGVPPDNVTALWRAVEDILAAFRAVLAKAEGEAHDPEPVSITQVIAPGLLTIIVGAVRRNAPEAELLKFQVILRAYASPSAVVHAFDIPACCTFYDGTTAYSTTLGAFAHRYRVNLVNPEYRSTTYESRLLKYFDRSYALGLTHLDSSALVAGSELCLPHLTLHPSAVRGNRASGGAELPEKQPDSDYAEAAAARTSYFGWDLSSTYAADYANLASLRSDTGRQILTRYRSLRGMPYYQAELDFEEDWFPFEKWGAEGPPNFDEVFPRDRFEAILERVVSGAINRSGQIQINSLRKYLGLTSDEVARFVQAVVTATAQHPHHRIKADRALQPFIDRLVTRYEEFAHRTIEWWITVDPGRQYTSSLNPRMENPEEWYGPGRVAAAPGTVAPEVYLASLEAALEDQARAAPKGRVYDNECSLCLNSVGAGDVNSLVLPCGHLFHASFDRSTGCAGLIKWLGTHQDCPNCRQNVIHADPRPERLHALPTHWLHVQWAEARQALPTTRQAVPEEPPTRQAPPTTRQEPLAQHEVLRGPVRAFSPGVEYCRCGLCAGEAGQGPPCWPYGDEDDEIRDPTYTPEAE